MYREPLDNYDILPEYMTTYLRHNGWHFNKHLYEWAASKMRKNGERVEPWTKQQTEELLTRYGITLENNEGYDACYVMQMARADFYGSSLTTEEQLARFVKDYVDDEDQADGFIMARFYADCCRKGVRVPWEDVV